MPARSAGILLYRLVADGLEVLLAHPGGPFWRNKDVGAWQIPKGLVHPGEDEQAAARRETAEELGIVIDGHLAPLGEVRQSGGKTVVAFAAERDVDPSAIISNMITIAWPPRTGRELAIPEVDEARWFPIDRARWYILPSQRLLLDRLAASLTQSDPSDVKRP